MKNMNYESPRFDFQEMRLMERIADKCWGNHPQAWYDADQDGVQDSNEIYSAQSCNDLQEKLWATFGSLEGFEFDDVKTNVKDSSPFKPIGS